MERMMDDLIKRDDATDAAMKAACDWVNGDTANPDEGVSFAIQAAITALPAIDPAAIREAALNTKLAECEARLGKAMEVLRPFAKAADTWEPDDGDSALGARIEHPHHGLERHAEFTFGDLRFARKVLAELEGKE